MHRLLITTALAGVLCAPAFAAEKVPPSPSAKLCREDRDKCEEMQDRRAEFCERNPKTCEAREKRRPEHQREEKEKEKQERLCKQHPDQCTNGHNDEEQFHPHTAAPGEHDPGPPR